MATEIITTTNASKDDIRAVKQPSSSFLRKLLSLRETNRKQERPSTSRASTAIKVTPAAETSLSRLTPPDESLDYSDTDSIRTLDISPASSFDKTNSNLPPKPSLAKQKMTAQTTSEYHQMIAQTISKRIQSVIPATPRHTQPTGIASLPPRRKSFWVGGRPDNDQTLSEDSEADNDEDDEEEDFWSLPMGDPVKPFKVANKYARARGSTPKVPDLGTVNEEEEEDDPEEATKRDSRSKGGSYFPPMAKHQKPPPSSPSKHSPTSSHAYISRYPIISISKKRTSLEPVSLNTPLGHRRPTSPRQIKGGSGRGDVRKLFELGHDGSNYGGAADKENEMKGRQDLEIPSVCLVSPEEDGNISVVLHQHDPTLTTYSSRESIAAAILKNPSPAPNPTKGPLFDYEDLEDRFGDEEGDAFMTACRQGSHFDTADTESESDDETEVTRRGADDHPRQEKGVLEMEVHVFPEMPQLEDTFEMPKTPSKGKQAKRIPLTVTTPRSKTLERSKSSSSLQQDFDKPCPASPDSSTSTIVLAESIVRPTGPGMWRQSYGADSLASEPGDLTTDTESMPQISRDSAPEKSSPPVADGDHQSGPDSADQTVESASSSSSEIIETPTTPKPAHTVSVARPERTLPRHWGSKRYETQQSEGVDDAYGSLAKRQEVMFAMGIDHSRTSSRDLQSGSASRAAHGTRLHRKSLRNIFGASGQCDDGMRHATVTEELGQRVPSMKRSMPSLRSAAPVNVAREHTEKTLAKKFSFASLSRAFRWSAKSTTTPIFQGSHMPSVTSGVTPGRELASPYVTQSETAHAHDNATFLNSISSAFASPTSTVVEDNGNERGSRSIAGRMTASPPPKMAQGPARKLVFSSALPCGTKEQGAVE